MEWIIGVLIYSIIWGVTCRLVSNNRNIKGHWFWWGFLFGIFAFIVLITKKPDYSYLEDTHLTKIANNTPINNRNSGSRVGWECPQCGNFNQLINGHCQCGYSTDETIKNSQKEKERQESNILAEGGWRCNCCGTLNNQYTFICRCGLKQKENDSYIKETNKESDENQKIEIIKKYKELLDMGAISQEEYEKKKSELM